MADHLFIAVLADDLTGGGDAGVLFCPTTGPVWLTSYPAAGSCLADIEEAALVLNTNSRHFNAGEASLICGWAAVELSKLSPQWVYKKIDSCLRGNVGAEIDAVVRGLGADMSFIAPALPLQGRTTKNDIHRVHGVPISETEMAHDPLNPVTSSRLSECVTVAGGGDVAHVDISLMCRGTHRVAERVWEFRRQGYTHMCFDAVTEEHLDLIIDLKINFFHNHKILLAGSAGLAAALARTLSGKGRKHAAQLRPKISRWLFVCGSLSKITGIQVARLVDGTGWPTAALKCASLAKLQTQSIKWDGYGELAAMYSQSSCILTIAPPDGLDRKQSPGEVISGLAEIVARLLEANMPDGLFLSGGDTAEAVLRRTGAKAVRLHEEILPGLMLGSIIGGQCHGVPVITKAGAFGNERTLTELVEILK